MSELTLKVDQIVDQSPNVKSFVLSNAAGGYLPPFTAGAHIDVTVTLEDGSTEVRSYSIASDPEATSTYTLGILREAAGTGGSAFMHDKVKVGDKLTATAPKNHFPLDEDAEDNVLIAGGIGVTPILSMARQLARTGATFHMHYAAKTPADMPFKADVEAVCGDNGDLYFDGGDPTKGVNLKEVLSHRPAGRHVFVCGPVGLIEAVRDTAKDLGWPENTVHFEVFKAAESAGEDAEIEVVLALSGGTYTVPANVSILDHLLAQGVDIDWDCKMGICGLCATKLLDGEPDHRDYVLTEDERNDEQQFCPCISRAKSASITLDI